MSGRYRGIHHEQIRLAHVRGAVDVSPARWDEFGELSESGSREGSTNANGVPSMLTDRFAVD